MKKIFKDHSPYLIGLTIFEIVFTIIAILAFVYQDVIDAKMLEDIQLLISNLYSQTWWGLVLLTLGFISIFSLTSIIYKKLDYLFISICLWILLFIISINLNHSLADVITNSMLFIPITIISIIAYKSEDNKLNNKKTTKK